MSSQEYKLEDLETANLSDIQREILFRYVKNISFTQVDSRLMLCTLETIGLEFVGRRRALLEENFQPALAAEYALKNAIQKLTDFAVAANREAEEFEHIKRYFNRLPDQYRISSTPPPIN